MKLRLYLVLALLPAVPLAQHRLDSLTGGFRAQEEVLYLWSGKQVRRLFPGFEALAADIYWLRTVQYFGGQHIFERGKRFDLLYPLIDITTTLDKRLEIAYHYGAIFLSEPPPMGAGNPQQGIAVLERGTKALPTVWRLSQDLGFFYFLYLHDAHKAADILDEASHIPGAPFWFRTLAADLLAKGGDRETSRRMWKQMYDQAEEGVIKSNAFIRLQILDALDQADRLTAMVQEFERRAGRRPRSLGELGALGVEPASRRDPAGLAFDYDSEKGQVTVSKESPLWRTDFQPRRTP
ncbi:MAG TPA: hypothetical protein VN461_10830 [Vicinamibacteria bacterium]|nr:hypothetical protein [Vicinamibacteria bacterium]